MESSQVARALNSLRARKTNGRWALLERGSVVETFYTAEAQRRSQMMKLEKRHSTGVFTFPKGFLKEADLPGDIDASEFDWLAFRVERALREFQKRLVGRYRKKLKEKGIRTTEVETRVNDFDSALRKWPPRALVSLLPQFVAETWDQLDRRLENLDDEAKARAKRLAKKMSDMTYSKTERTRAEEQLALILNIRQQEKERLEYAAERLTGSSKFPE